MSISELMKPCAGVCTGGLICDFLNLNNGLRSSMSRRRIGQEKFGFAAPDSAERLHLVLPKAQEPVAPTHRAFSQLASIAGAPAS